ncbi:MAG: hypothetical protein AB9844_06025 [Clostridiaceae bacterium]
MILETDRAIALKNNKGTYDISTISFFRGEEADVSISITRQKFKSGSNLTLKIRCPLCGVIHSYKYGLRDFFVRQLLVGGCEFTGMPLFYIGYAEKVQEKISRIKKIEKKICAYT